MSNCDRCKVAYGSMCVDSDYNEMFRCQYELMKVECSEDAARVFVTYGQKTHARRLLSTNCTLGQFSYQGRPSYKTAYVRLVFKI